MTTRRARFVLCLGCCFLICLSALTRSDGQDKKKPPKKIEPRVLLALPLGVKAGATTKVTIRGLVLDTATAVRFPDSKVSVKIVGKGKAAVPDKNPTQVGDTHVIVEVVVPAGLRADRLSFVVVTPAGQTKRHELLMETTLPVVAEKEPNDGFRQAQKIQVPQVIEGTIERPKDVDVFSFQGKAGQRVSGEVLAARYGSPLDSILTLYTADGNELASNDDGDASLDSRLEAMLPRDGTYYLSLIDAHDSGSPIHVYRLAVRLSK